MRIVNRAEFLKLPSGILYSRYESLGTIRGLHSKLESLTNDWIYQDVVGDIDEDENEFDEIFAKAEKDSSYEFRMDLNCGRRDGMFDDDDKFAIYNEEDIRRLIDRLNKLL
ncbi:hypothetical protein [Paenibacillus xylaniclasticus]|uniref:hypothetical protein n=1 Tax=Paenibacillus xylaniclasticus TaxID=588083 RepID=UPI000FD716BA|nr:MULTISPECIES: hypothetical protein [Paenibacillus]GFN32518.1 hypothetical protein PCURB6_27780 [Paenibacillus curdlanolyticus]